MSITIVHGGQTGVDRGAHEAALNNNWLVAGYMPRDQRDELGKIPHDVARFLTPHDKTGYAPRTEANVHAAHAALIVARDRNDPRATPGTAMTLDLVADRRLRWMIVDPTNDPATIARWIWSSLLRVQLPLPLDTCDLVPAKLLVAGPRESKWPGARVETAALLRRIALALAEIPRTLAQKQDLAKAQR